MWRSLISFLFVAAALCVPTHAAVIFDGTFTGDFATANWSLVLGPSSNGGVYTGGAPASITVDGSNDDGNMLPPDRYGDGLTTYRITIPSSGTVRFSWQYQTVDTNASYDIAGFVLNGAYSDLSSAVGATSQSGVAQFDVIAGDVFGFFVDPIDNTGGAASLTISQAPLEAIPEPSTFGLLGAALAALCLLRSRRAH